MRPLHRHSSNEADWLNSLQVYRLLRSLLGYCVVLWLLSCGVVGQTAAQLFAQADSAYKAGDAERAIHLLRDIIEDPAGVCGSAG